MADNKAVPTGRERRDFFRITQDVFFDYKLADAFTAENETPEAEFDDSVSLNLLNELRRLDKDNSQVLRLLTEKNRLLGDYLQSLSSKIDLIARHTLFAQDSTNGNKNRTRLNLSEEGLAFMCERALYKGSYLTLRLVFLPSYTPITVFAKVLRCEQKENEYQVAARFHRLEEADRQALSRQIMKAQVSAKKAQTTQTTTS